MWSGSTCETVVKHTVQTASSPTGSKWPIRPLSRSHGVYKDYSCASLLDFNGRLRERSCPPLNTVHLMAHWYDPSLVDWSSCVNQWMEDETHLYISDPEQPDVEDTVGEEAGDVESQEVEIETNNTESKSFIICLSQVSHHLYEGGYVFVYLSAGLHTKLQTDNYKTISRNVSWPPEPTSTIQPAHQREKTWCQIRNEAGRSTWR